MADVNLVVRAHLRGERELNKAERKLARIALAAKAADNNMASLGASSKKFGRIMEQTSKRFELIMTDWDKLVKGFGSLITKVLGGATKFMVAEFALVAASMIVVHGLFKIGRWLMKGYHGAIKMMAGAAAGAAAALSVLSAAIREQQAAMFSYKGLERNYKDLKGGIAAVRMEMRGMATDVTMAAMGIENLNTIFAGASQRGTFNKGLTKGLMDIAAAGQPLEAAAKWLGEVVGLLTDPKVNMGEIRKSFEGMGELGKKTWETLRKRGINSVEKVKNAIRTGLISEIAGVEGQWDAVSGTLVSRFKAAFTIIRTDFADIGDAFLGDVKGSLDEVTIIFRRLLFKIRADVVRFGKGGLLGGLVSAMEKIESGMVKLMTKWLPKAEGMFGRIADWWGRFTDGWKKVTSSLAPLLSAARVLEDMFMNILRPIGDYFSSSFKNLRIFLIDSKKDFLAHGTAIGSLLEALLGFKTAWTEMFQDAMPFINKMIDGVTQLVETFTSFAKGVKGLVGGITGGRFSPLGKAEGKNPGLGSAFTMMALSQAFRGAKNTKGTFVEKGLDLKNLNNMTVTAANVNINGAPMGAGGGAGGGGKALADYGYAPSAAVIHATRNSTLGLGGGAAAAAGGAAAAGAGGWGAIGGSLGVGGAAVGPRLFGANDYNTADKYQFGPPGQGVMRPGAGSGTGYTSPNEQLSMDTLLGEQAATPYFNEGTMRFHRRDKEFGAGNMVPNAVGMASLGLSPSGGVLEEYMKPQGAAEQGSLFTSDIGAAAPGTGPGGFVEPGFSRTALAPSAADRLKREVAGGGGLAASLGGAYGDGTGANGLDFSQMTPGQLKEVIRANEEVARPGGGVERNPYYGKSVGRSLAGAARGKAGRKALRGNLKAAWQREKLMSTTRLTSDPTGPKTLRQKMRTKAMRRLGAGSARSAQIRNKVGSGSGFGTRMGVGMGMGVASGFMSDEAQGAMNLGSSIAMINPLLGAAVGLGGTALKAQTAAGGAMAGAGAGAALGGMIGPQGAVVGAIVGAIAGGVMGHFGKGKAAREKVEANARETASEIWGGMISGIDNARAGGKAFTGKRMKRVMNVDRMGGLITSGNAANALQRKGGRQWDEEAGKWVDQTENERAGHAARQAVVQDIYNNQTKFGVSMTTDERDEALKRPFEFLDEMLPEITKHHGVATTVLDKYSNRMEHMTGMFDVSEEKLLEMAGTVGVNLYDAAQSTTEMIKQLSGALMQTRDAINQIFEDQMATTYESLDVDAKAFEASIAMDESARAWKEKVDAGDVGQGDAERFLQDQMGYAIDLAKGDSMAGEAMFNRLFANDKAFTQTNGVLAGDKYRSSIMTGNIPGILADQASTFDERKVSSLRRSVTGNLMGAGVEGTLKQGVMQDLDFRSQQHLAQMFAGMTALETGGEFKDDDGNLNAAGRTRLKDSLNDILGPGAITNLTALKEGVGTEALSGEDMAGFADTFKTSVGTFEVAVKDLAAKLSTGDTKHPMGDTSSAMAGTLAAHDRISGGLAGKRTITSGYRNYALGSSNSDHVTGRALDLVGDNLGAYQQGIKSGGGYAEFHGMGDSRHLHTVPAVGDTSSSQGGMGGGSSTNNYTINVTGGPNANSQEVASMVMNEIQNLNRSNRERS